MAVKLHFHGAARTVTGSCYLIETDQAKLLVDCGMFQGSQTERELNARPFPFDPAGVTNMMLTHAHIDHSGVIPKLTKHGFKGKIFCTPPTIELCAAMLADSGNIQEQDAKFQSERNLRLGKPPVEPLYTVEDAQAAMQHFSSVAYDTWFSPVPGIRARYWNAGHLLGSASIETEIDRGGGQPPIRLLFSGDIGPEYKMLEPDPKAPSGLDFVVCESTYGGRDRVEHTEEDRRADLAVKVNAAAMRKGALLIPSFAVERTQELVTDLVTLMEESKVPPANIFIDSPLASKATAVFMKYAGTMEHGDNLERAFKSPLVKVTESVEESKGLARFKGFHIIVAASGMCEAGRIRHHLKNHLWDQSTTVLLAGYQAEGTLGRILQEGAKNVTIMGDDIVVKAVIDQIEDYSGHADGPELVSWMKGRLPVAKSVFLTHGEDDSQLGLARDLVAAGIAEDCIIRPKLDDVFDLTGPACAQLASSPRIDPNAVASRDSNNELADLLLHIKDQVGKAGDEQAKSAIIRRLRRSLAGDGPPAGTGDRRRPPVSGPSRRSRGFDES